MASLPTNPPLIGFFHNYLLAKSLHPEQLAQFGCAKKLEDQAIPLFALDHNPLAKPILKGDINSQILHLHREIIRNLYQIVIISSDKSNKAIHAVGIKNGLLFVAKDDQFLKQVLNPKIYFKFNSEFSEETKEEYFIPTKNYQRIKKYLSKLDQLEIAKNKNDKNIKSSFAVSYSAFVNGLSIDSKRDHQFAWIDEIRQTPYFSFYDLTTYLINADQDSQMLWMGVLLGYSYTYELLHSNFILIKAINELGLAPNSILPLIERSLKSGNKEFCHAVKNSEKPIAVDQLNQKQRKVFDVLWQNIALTFNFPKWKQDYENFLILTISILALTMNVTNNSAEANMLNKFKKGFYFEKYKTVEGAKTDLLELQPIGSDVNALIKTLEGAGCKVEMVEKINWKRLKKLIKR